MLLSPTLTHEVHTPYQCCCVHTLKRVFFIPEWAEEPPSSAHPDLLLIQVTLLFLLQEQGILWGPNMAQHQHFGTSKHPCCPGSERKTSPLPANVTSSMDGFKRIHFLTHCPHNASDFETTLPTTPFFPDPVSEYDLNSSCNYSFLAHLILLLVLIIWYWVVISISR